VNAVSNLSPHLDGGSPQSPPACPLDETIPATVPALVAVLHQLEDLLDALTDEQYTRKPVGVVSSNVGGHVRHCLDHIDTLLSALEHGSIDYDQRQRGTEIETSRVAALAAVRRQMNELRLFPANSANWPLRLTAIVSSALPPVEADTSVGRELTFVLSHTIHHNALIGVMVKTLGVALPPVFGYAPSTIAHLEGRSCAR
jgi:uncharacterized damage-inducible protein DinB